VTGIDEQLVTLFDSRAVFWLALVVALGVGAAHAVAPGHGKSITAAYLLGTRARHRDALRLGAIVAVMHTCSVLVLALVWVGLSGAASLGTKALTAWMQIAAGVLVIGVGAHLTWRHVRGRSHGTDHPHPHPHPPSAAHPHSHPHPPRDDGRSPGSLAEPPGTASGAGDRRADGALLVRRGPDDRTGRHTDPTGPTDPWSRRGLTALALSGGLLPSPSAFLVLVSGLLTGRAADALVLVLAFGAGMAATLTGVGVATIRGFALLSRGVRRWPAAVAAGVWIPAAAGVAVSIGGCLYLVAAISALSGRAG